MHRGALAQLRTDVGAPVDQVGALLDAEQTKPAAVMADGLDVEPDAVVGHGQLREARCPGRQDGHTARASMGRRVSQRLLGDPEEAERGVVADVAKVSLGLESHLHVVPLLYLDAVRLERTRQAGVAQHPWMQVV